LLNKRQTGAVYEEKAAKFLIQQGFRILQKNYRCQMGEIDLIAIENGILVFVEVKYRNHLQKGYPAEAVTHLKQRKIIQTARYYCYKKKIPQTQSCRFDVVSILGEQIELIRNAFEVV